MTYFPDLSPYSYGFGPLPWGADGPRSLDPTGLYGWQWGPEGAFDLPEVSVGWLEAPHAFPVGRMADDLIEKLERLCSASRYHATRGFHSCTFCNQWVEGLGSCEVRITNGVVVYAAPNLIAHYVREHDYAPPEGFVDALRRENPIAEPRTDAERPVLLQMIPRSEVDPAALEASVHADLKAAHRDAVFPRVSITGHDDAIEVVAEIDIRPVDKLLTRSWNIPARALLNMKQATHGVCTMLESVHSAVLIELAPWKRTTK